MTEPQDMTDAEHAYWEGRAEQKKEGDAHRDAELAEAGITTHADGLWGFTYKGEQCISPSLAESIDVRIKAQVNKRDAELQALREAVEAMPDTGDGQFWSFVVAVLRGEVDPGDGAEYAASFIEDWIDKLKAALAARGGGE